MRRPLIGKSRLQREAVITFASATGVASSFALMSGKILKYPAVNVQEMALLVIVESNDNIVLFRSICHYIWEKVE